MNNNWQRVKLDDVCDLIAGFAFKGKDFGEEFQSKVIKIADIQPPNVKMDSLTGIDVSKYDESKLQKYRVGIGDYVFAMTGATIGKLGRIQEGEAYINQRVLTFRNNLNVCDKDFLYYVLAQPSFLGYILNHIDSETAQPNISASSVGTFEFYLPPISTQKQIANALRGLDDKIELNNKINRNLEAQAQAIFKSWFIDFEPFKNGKFIDSELGKIPEGWKVGSFSEVSDLLGGGTPKTTNNKFWNGTIPFFTPKDAVDVFVIETDRSITKEGLDNCHTKLYPKGTIFITARGTVGKISLSGIEMAMNQSCYAIMPKHNIPTLFLYYQTVILIKKLKNKASGAVFDAITTRDFDEAIIIPPLPIMNKFSETIESIFEAILNNIIQAKVQSKTRDALLPKLISGKIHVLDSNH